MSPARTAGAERDSLTNGTPLRGQVARFRFDYPAEGCFDAEQLSRACLHRSTTATPRNVCSLS